MKNGDCGVFRWEEEVGRINISWEELKGKLFEKGKVIVELELEKIILDKKVKKLKIKRDNLEEAMQLLQENHSFATDFSVANMLQTHKNPL